MQPITRRRFIKAGALFLPAYTLLRPPPVQAAISLLTHTAVAAGVTSSVTTSAIDTTGANFIIAAQMGFNGTVGTFSDSKGNTWTSLTQYGSVYRILLIYCLNPTVGAGHTFSITGSANFPTIAVASFSGVKTSSPQDGLEVGVGDQSAGPTIQPGLITAAGANELFITATLVFGGGDITPTINSSFIITDASDGGGATFGYGLAYKINGGAENPTWTDTNSQRSTTMAAFLPAGAVATGSKHRGRIL